MAGPPTVGVSSGAAVGAVVTIVSSLSIPFGSEGAAFVSAVVTAFVVYLPTNEDGWTPVTTLLLAGVAIRTLLSAIIPFLLLQSGESLRQVVFWFMGHPAGATWGKIGMFSLVLSLLFLPLVVHVHDLNVLLLGEEDTHALGIEVEWTK